MATGAAGVGETSSEDRQKAEIRLRKAAFQTISHYHGVQSSTYLGASFIHPAATPGLFDAANLRIKLGVRRLRASASLVVNQTKTVNSDAKIEASQDRIRKGTFDDETNEKYGAPIIARFSSSPLPHFNTATDLDGRIYTRMIGDDIGQTSALDLVFGQKIFDAPLTSLTMNGLKRTGFGSSLDITSPTGVLILDKLVHRPTFPQLDCEFTVHWVDNPAFPAGTENDTGLQFCERLVKLDAGVDGARTHEVPQYIEMLEFVCDRFNWKIEDFDVYRVRVEYPLHYTRIWTKFAPVASAANL
jgi:hypothetical protein